MAPTAFVKNREKSWFMTSWYLSLSKKPGVVLLLLWLFATALNINKAFHIDDTFHLEAAQWIEQHPLQPMSGVINWGGKAAPMHEFNQPPLYFYMVALVGHFFGYTELALHLFQSVFTFTCIFVFYRLARLLQPQYALFLTAFFVLNPAFLVNQNLMVDIPLLSFHLLFAYFLLTPTVRSVLLRYSLAAIFLSFALLIKYTSLPLVVVLMLVPLIRKQYVGLLATLIPIGVLAAWTAFNYAEFGGAHIINRPKNELAVYEVLRMAALFLLCLGGILPYFLILSFAYVRKWKRKATWAALLLVLLFVVLWGTAYSGVLETPVANRLLYGLAAINGLAVVLIILRECFEDVFSSTVLSADTTVVLLWLLAMAGFLVLFAPFMATRHVLLCLPAFLLLSAKVLNRISTGTKRIVLAFTFVLSSVVSVSDWIYADVYRQQAVAIRQSLPENAQVWTVGHWGWQWYSREAGMIQYDEYKSVPNPSDYMVVPVDVAQQDIAKAVKMEKLKTIYVESNWLTFLTNAQTASLYTSFTDKIPWTLSKAPVAEFEVHRVISVEE